MRDKTILPRNVRLLCQCYEVGAPLVDTLVRLAEESNERGWWAAFSDTLPDWFESFVGLESDAAELWNYQPSVVDEFVPGLRIGSAKSHRRNIGPNSKAQATKMRTTRTIIDPHRPFADLGTAESAPPHRAREILSRRRTPARAVPAHVAALATWIDRKLPEILHVALSDGVRPADAAAAAGITVDDLAHRWKKWAQQAGTLTSADYDRIHRVLADAEHTA